MKDKKLEILSVTIFILALGFLYWDSVYSMVIEWYTDENYSHGFLIPVISGYLLWQKKDDIKSAVVSPSNLGLPIALLGLFVYLVGNVAGENFTMRLSLLLVAAAAIVFAYGFGLFRTILFPYCYLFFMLPLPFILYDSVAFPLKLLVTQYSVGFLKLIGIPVMREGNIIVLTTTTLEVADACSGIRSIMSLLALSTALAYFTQRGAVKKTILALMAIPIALVANSIRVIGTGMLASRFGPSVAEGFFHEFAGLVIFGAAILMLILSAFTLGKLGGRDKQPDNQTTKRR